MPALPLSLAESPTIVLDQSHRNRRSQFTDQSRGVEPTDYEGEYARSDDPQADAVTSSAWSACLLLPLMLMSALLTQSKCSAINSVVEVSRSQNLQHTKVNRRRPRTERRHHLVCNVACCCSRGSSSHARQCLTLTKSATPTARLFHKRNVWGRNTAPIIPCKHYDHKKHDEFKV